MRTRAILLAIALLCAAAPAAHAARVITWTTASRYVNPAGLAFNDPTANPPPTKLPVDVYLPDGYDGTRRFPILYLLHGHGDNYSSWLDGARGDLLQIAKGFRGIVVMPEADQGWYTDWWNGGAFGSPGWESYHLDELIPLVERRLRILPGRANRAIVGNSMGGEGAAYYAEQRPGYFGTVASFSGTLSIQRSEWPAGFNTQGEDYQTVYGPPSGYWATGHNPTALVENLRYTRALVRVGDGTPNPASQSEVRNTFGQLAEAELRMHAQDFVSAAQHAGVDVTFEPHQGIHDWPYWRADVQAAIAWGLFKPVTEHPATWTFSTVDRHSVAWGYTFDFTRVPTALETFAYTRCALSASGSGGVRVTPPSGRAFTTTLPFSRHVRACARPPRPGSGGRIG